MEAAMHVTLRLIWLAEPVRNLRNEICSSDSLFHDLRDSLTFVEAQDRLAGQSVAAYYSAC